MKPIIAVLVLIISFLTFNANAQVFPYNNYCSGMQIDSCRQVVHHSTCQSINGTIVFNNYQITIDSLNYYVLTTDTLITPISERIVYYAQTQSKPIQPASIIKDRTKGIITLITIDPVTQVLLNMTFYMFVLK